MSDFTGNNSQLINFERRRKQWEVFRVLETYQGLPYSFEYAGPCGGFLYHSGVCDDEAISQALKAVERPAPPDIRPELRDFRVSSSSTGGDSNQEFSMNLDDDVCIFLIILLRLFSNFNNILFYFILSFFSQVSIPKNKAMNK
jgi:hypothetical protein